MTAQKQVQKSEQTSSSDIARLTRAVEVLIALLLEFPVDRVVPAREKMARLDGIGLDPADIARVLNKDRTAVNSELSKMRKSKKGAAAQPETEHEPEMKSE